MMKWGRKKPSFPSPSHSSSSSSSIFPSSWFSKIKRTTKNKPAKGEGDAGCKDMQIPPSWNNCRFYGGGENSDWRLSFGGENYEIEKSRGGLKSVWYDSDDENQEFGFTSCRSCRADDAAEREESLKFNQMVSNIRKLRQLRDCEGAKGGEIGGFEKRNRGDLKEKKVVFEKQLDKAKDANLVLKEKDILELKPVKLTRATKGGNQIKGAFPSKCNSEIIKEDYKLGTLNLNEEKVSSESEKSKEKKLKELIAKSENQRKSVYINTKKSSKIRAYSPRTAYKIECKIKAIESMKRAKKKEKKMREKPAQVKTAFDSFAVVKNSLDPQIDFKNSMIEMITAKGIEKSEELEELLACYLTLNADIYHDTIIKVFRQVWFELIRDHLVLLSCVLMNECRVIGEKPTSFYILK